MVETKILIDKKQLRYEGIFRLDEFYAVMMRFFKERNYVQVEIRNEEKQQPDGISVFIEIHPYRKMSDYIKKAFLIEIFMYRVKDKEVTVNGRLEKFKYGEVLLLFTLKIVTDWRQRFEGTGFYFFLRTLMDKFIRYDVIREIEDEAVKDLVDLQEELKDYFNMTRFKMVEPGTERARIRETV